jgi:hypothetical protein
METSTASSKKLVRDHIFERNGKLRKEKLQYLIDLEGNSSNENHVVSDLKDVYHELSKPLHFPFISGTGLFCGGKMPLRAAVGISILTLQKLYPAFKMSVRYCDENFKDIAVLQGGKIMKVERSEGL